MWSSCRRAARHRLPARLAPLHHISIFSVVAVVDITALMLMSMKM